MISQKQNDLYTRVGPGTPAGTLLRHYWQPVALTDEFEGARKVKAVRLFGENFVLFQDEDGCYGLLDRDCPHRGADLAFGRREQGGLRCPFHGWLFAADGTCLETPAEPIGSQLCKNIRQKAYPVEVHAGVIFAYVGADEPPAFPELDCFTAPDSHTFAFKGLWECNWLQSLEVGMDPAHASFLHRFFEDDDPEQSYGKQFRSTTIDSDLPITKVLRDYDRPEISVETVKHGLRLSTLRRIDETHTHVRITNIVFPQTFVIPMSPTVTITQWHVPVDDHNNYWFTLFTSFDAPVDKATMRAQRLETYPEPDYRPLRNRANNWGHDLEEQATATYLGMGFDINIHDQWACESQGPIQDRTREHLGTSDKGIIAYRRLLAAEIAKAEKGEPPLMRLSAEEAPTYKGPVSFDGVDSSGDTETYWRAGDAKRRAAAPWGGPVEA
ncbi:Rieske 2Fe-2S domain-containing protein [Rhodospirillum sp. A1_3_36]|uniref:Rieske 2Fe-2S domain-containing protein n=1 Tax=Rhodospirillum sp. A1_3_36 TaxID=3391666 RepID=UPI0039A582DB